MSLMAEVLDQTPTISVITEIEALSWVSTDKNKELIVKEFIQLSNVIALTQDIVDQSIKVKRSRKIKTPDAIIASTAIVYNLTLISSDSDFSNIPGLRVIDPTNL